MRELFLSSNIRTFVMIFCVYFGLYWCESLACCYLLFFCVFYSMWVIEGRGWRTDTARWLMYAKAAFHLQRDLQRQILGSNIPVKWPLCFSSWVNWPIHLHPSIPLSISTSLHFLFPPCFKLNFPLQNSLVSICALTFSNVPHPLQLHTRTHTHAHKRAVPPSPSQFYLLFACSHCFPAVCMHVSLWLLCLVPVSISVLFHLLLFLSIYNRMSLAFIGICM